MTYKIKRIVSVLCLVAAIFSATLLPVSGYCETLRFVFLADSRGTSTSDLINTAALTAINTKILKLSPRPSFVVFGGDQAYRGYSNGAYNFQAFKNAMKALTNAGIKLYTVLGNHELYVKGQDGFFLSNQKEFQNEFSDNPTNGPSGYGRLVYSFASPGGDAFFAVLDAYYLTTDILNPNLHGNVDDTQRTWLASQLAQTKATHKFLFIHPPYYSVTEAQSSQNTSYTNLWSILDNNSFDIYCCGHVHLYSRKTIDSSIAPNPQLSPPVQWKNNVVQLLNGTCGAPVDTSPLTVDRSLWHVFNGAHTHYFSVVDINGSNVTVNSYSGGTSDYNVIDSFTINKNALPGVDLLLDRR